MLNFFNNNSAFIPFDLNTFKVLLLLPSQKALATLTAIINTNYDSFFATQCKMTVVNGL